jgi:cellobiose-specific phosphotransferase system component IIA
MGLVMAAGIAAKESGEAPSKAAEEKTEEAEKAVDVS